MQRSWTLRKILGVLTIGIFLISSAIPSAQSDDLLDSSFSNQRKFSSTLTLGQAQTNEDTNTENKLDPPPTNTDQTLFDPNAPPSETDNADSSANTIFGTTRQEADLYIQSAADTASNTLQSSLYFPETELNVTAALDGDSAFLFPGSDHARFQTDDLTNTETDTLYSEEFSLSQNRRESDLFVETVPYMERPDFAHFDYRFGQSEWSWYYWIDMGRLPREIQALADEKLIETGASCGDNCSTAEGLVLLPGISEFYPNQWQIQAFSTSQEFTYDNWRQFLSNLTQKYYDFGANITIPGPDTPQNSPLGYPLDYIDTDRVLDMIENGTTEERSYIREFEITLDAGDYSSPFNNSSNQYWVNSSQVTRKFRINLRDDTGRITEFFRSVPPETVGEFVRETFEDDPQPGIETTPSAEDVILLKIKTIQDFNYYGLKSDTIFVATSTEVGNTPAIKTLFGVDIFADSGIDYQSPASSNQIYISPDLSDYGYDLLFKPFEWDEFYDYYFRHSAKLYTSSLIRLALDGTLNHSESDPIREEIAEGWLQTFENKEDLQTEFLRRFGWDLWNKYKTISIVTGDNEDQEDRVVAALDLGESEEAAFKNYRIFLNNNSRETTDLRYKDYYTFTDKELEKINRWLSDYPTPLIYRMGSFSKGIYNNRDNSSIKYDTITPSYINATFGSQNGTVNRLLVDDAVGFAVTTMNFNPFRAYDGTMNDVRNKAFNANVHYQQPTTPGSSSFDLNLYNETYGRRPYLFNQHPLRIELFNQARIEGLTIEDPFYDSIDTGKFADRGPYQNFGTEWLWGVMRNTDLRLTELLEATQSNVLRWEGNTPIYENDDPDKFASFRILLSSLLPMAATYSIFEPSTDFETKPDDMITKDSPIFTGEYYGNRLNAQRSWSSEDYDLRECVYDSWSKTCTPGAPVNVFVQKMRLPIYQGIVSSNESDYVFEENNAPVGYLPIEVTCKKRNSNWSNSYAYNPSECNITRVELNLIPAEGSPDAELQFHESFLSAFPDGVDAVNIHYEFSGNSGRETPLNYLLNLPTGINFNNSSGVCDPNNSTKAVCYSPIDAVTFEYSSRPQEDYIHWFDTFAYPAREVQNDDDDWYYNIWNPWVQNFNSDSQ